jgi:DNA mismatch repair protein MutS
VSRAGNSPGRLPKQAEPARYGELVSQYLELRDAHPGVFLLFRVGSFYEVLFEDAEVVARELGLKLSERPSGGQAGPVPQCGFAAHALDAFLPRLLARGYRVAVCEEDEAESSGGVRRRSVVRTLTPGTVTDPALLLEDQPTYLAALVGGPADGYGLAWTDVSTGEFKAGEFDQDGVAAELQRLQPAELLVPTDLELTEALLGRWNRTAVAGAAGAADALWSSYPGAQLHDLPLAQTAAGLIVRYVSATQGTQDAPLDAPEPALREDAVQLDAATQRHLELAETERRRERAGSLLDVLDRAHTPMGRRILREWLLRPLLDLGKIRVRQAIVAELLERPDLRAALAEVLSTLPDIERLAGRAAAYRTSAEDLRVAAGIGQQVAMLGPMLARAQTSFLRGLARARPMMSQFNTQAQRVLADPQAGYPIARGVSDRLDEALDRLDGAARWQQQFLHRMREAAATDRLKLDRTSTQGFFLEVPVNTPVPRSWTRRGGLQKVERYSTPELEQHAIDLAEAEAVVAVEIRTQLSTLREAAARIAPDLRDLARHLAAADALLAFATVAAERGWVRPEVDDGNAITIRAGRHPVMELPGPFQPNDAQLAAAGEHDQLVVLTGPNMAGKSTWMRQIALIVVLAQIGSWVPASSARIGLVDAIFTRIGAVDDLAGGRSTFMVEMLETAAVLRGATSRSLVLLDEIGRGTSTHDGMAIAWAVTEHLATGLARPRAVIATHYHELAALGQLHAQVTLLQAAVAEQGGAIEFPHRIEAGAADRSFGIEVARLAGLPPEVLRRAQRVAEVIEPTSIDLARRLGATDAGPVNGFGRSESADVGSSTSPRRPPASTTRRSTA